MSQLDSTLQDIDSDFATLIAEFDNQNDVPPPARTYARDMQYYAFELDEYKKAADGLDSLKDLLTKSGFATDDPLVTLVSELSTNLYWMDEQLNGSADIC